MSQRHCHRPPSVRSLAEYQFGAFLGRDPVTESWEARTADGTTCVVRLVYGVSDRILTEARARVANRSHPAVQFPRLVGAGPGCVAVIAEQVVDTVHERNQSWRHLGQPAPTDEIVDWLGQTAAVLDDLAGWNLPHLGLQPRCLGFRKGRICILEFGLVGLLQLPAGKGAGPLACRFAAPELLTSPSRACDVYALAAIARHLAGGAGNEPESWQSALRQALDSDPARRFRTCGEFVAALKHSDAPVAHPSRTALPAPAACVPAAAPPMPEVEPAPPLPAAADQPSAKHAVVQPSTPAEPQAEESDVVFGAPPTETSLDDSLVLLGEMPLTKISESAKEAAEPPLPRVDSWIIDLDAVSSEAAPADVEAQREPICTLERVESSEPAVLADVYNLLPDSPPAPEVIPADGSAQPETLSDASLEPTANNAQEASREECISFFDIEPSQEVHPADIDSPPEQLVFAEALEDDAEADDFDTNNALDPIDPVLGSDSGDLDLPGSDPRPIWPEEDERIDFPSQDGNVEDTWLGLGGGWPTVQPQENLLAHAEFLHADVATAESLAGLTPQGERHWNSVALEEEPADLATAQASTFETPLETHDAILSVSLSTPHLPPETLAAPADSPSAHLQRLEILNPSLVESTPADQATEANPVDQAFESIVEANEDLNGSAAPQALLVDSQMTALAPTEEEAPSESLPGQECEQMVGVDFSAGYVLPTPERASRSQSPPAFDDDQPIDVDFGATRVVAPSAFALSPQYVEKPDNQPVDSNVDLSHDAPAPLAHDDDPMDINSGATRVVPTREPAPFTEPQSATAPPTPRQHARVMPVLPPSRKSRNRRQRKQEKEAAARAKAATGNKSQPAPQSPKRDRRDEVPAPLPTQNADSRDTNYLDYASSGNLSESLPPAELSPRPGTISPVVLSEALRAHVAQMRATLFTDAGPAPQALPSAELAPANVHDYGQEATVAGHEEMPRQEDAVPQADLTVIEWLPATDAVTLPVFSNQDEDIPESMTRTTPTAAAMEPAVDAPPSSAEDVYEPLPATTPEECTLTATQNCQPAATSSPETTGPVAVEEAMTQTQANTQQLANTLKARKVRSARVRARLAREGRPDLCLGSDTILGNPLADAPPSTAPTSVDPANDPWLQQNASSSSGSTEGLMTNSSPLALLPDDFPLSMTGPTGAGTVSRSTQQAPSSWDAPPMIPTANETNLSQTGDLQGGDWAQPGAATIPGSASAWSWSEAPVAPGAEMGPGEALTPPWEDAFAGQPLPITWPTEETPHDPPVEAGEVGEGPSPDRAALARALAAQVAASLLDAAQTAPLDDKADPWKAWETPAEGGTPVPAPKDRFEPSPALARLLEDAAHVIPEGEPEIWVTLPDGRKQLQCSFPASLPPNVSAVAFEGFRRQWNADLKTSDDSGVTFYIGPSTGFWQRWLGRATGMLVELRWQRGPESKIPRVDVQIRPAGRSADQSPQELGPLVMDSLRNMLQGPSNRRSERRLVWPHPIQVSFLLSSGEVSGTLEGMGKDVNRLGAAIYLPRILPGCQVRLEFNNPDNPGPVRVLGRFVRVNRCGEQWFEVAALFEENVEVVC